MCTYVGHINNHKLRDLCAIREHRNAIERNWNRKFFDSIQNAVYLSVCASLASWKANVENEFAGKCLKAGQIQLFKRGKSTKFSKINK